MRKRKKNNSGIRKILISFSTNDIEYLANALVELDVKDNIEVIVTFHPTTDKIKLSQYLKNKWSFKFDIINEQTLEIISDCYLVITGYSNIAYEAYFFKVYSVRIVPISIFPPRESNNFSLDFNNAIEFNKWFSKRGKNLYDKRLLNKMEKLSIEYYYSNDGNASKRLKGFLDNNKLPHNS